jgi:hypothetical protein
MYDFVCNDPAKNSILGKNKKKNAIGCFFEKNLLSSADNCQIYTYYKAV